ncbi:DUF3365 domain-containing protein [Mangrovicoccus sp. HB161399]|uniref:Tll0287-like domain-containing protein n=1 Tax=Mangrovicoccus sp. HB161399 TaxID=2720392 RepID=UPI001552C41E|nr:DUF3365 domain-containing protein [Mangrovicoccus sp. HB161399]
MTCRLPAALALLILPALPAGAQSLEDSAARLAELLRAGRAVISENQALINDPGLGDKGLTPEAFLSQVTAAFLARTGSPAVSEDLPPFQRALAEAQLEAMGQTIAEAQPLINMEGVGFKGFIPAVFARLANERFGELADGRAAVKITAPPELVRNRKARPDDWERAVIEDRFLSAGWTRGEAYAEETGPGFRMLIPEYYSESCLACHGSPAGETDVTGFPKEGKAAGDLGGAISITLRP